MKLISQIVTGIFLLLFLINMAGAASIQTPYGSPATSPPYVFGLLLGHAIIPGIFWLITYFVLRNSSSNLNNRKDAMKEFKKRYTQERQSKEEQREAKYQEWLKKRLNK